MTIENIKEINALQTIQDSHLPVILVFQKKWSGVGQIIESMSGRLQLHFRETIKIFNIDTERYPYIADKYGVCNPPAILFLKNGKLIDSVSGMIPYEVFEEKIKSVI